MTLSMLDCSVYNINFSEIMDKVKNDDKQIFFMNQGTNMLCGLFAVNHMVGSWKYTAEDFDDISGQMHKISGTSHSHCCCKGDYDANILLQALQTSGYQSQWIDIRKQVSQESLGSFVSAEAEGQQNQVVGFLLNIPIIRQSVIMRILAKITCASQRHWLCIKKIQSQFYLMDSCDHDPKLIPVEQLMETLERYRKEEAIIITLKKKISSLMNLQTNCEIQYNKIEDSK